MDQQSAQGSIGKDREHFIPVRKIDIIEALIVHGALGAELIVADEPTTALDVTVQAEIIGLVQELKREIGMAIIWITHDLGVVAGIADTVQVMYAGRILERGPVDDLFRDDRAAIAEMVRAITQQTLDNYGAGITITGPTLRAYRRLGLLDLGRGHGAVGLVLVGPREIAGRHAAQRNS